MCRKRGPKDFRYRLESREALHHLKVHQRQPTFPTFHPLVTVTSAHSLRRTLGNSTALCPPSPGWAQLARFSTAGCEFPIRLAPAKSRAKRLLAEMFEPQLALTAGVTAGRARRNKFPQWPVHTPCVAGFGVTTTAALPPEVFDAVGPLVVPDTWCHACLPFYSY